MHKYRSYDRKSLRPESVIYKRHPFVTLLKVTISLLSTMWAFIANFANFANFV